LFYAGVQILLPLFIINNAVRKNCHDNIVRGGSEKTTKEFEFA
jgi:hypothetical protein